MTDEQTNEIARQIKDGYTSGRLDEENYDGDCEYLACELKTEIWTDS